MADSSNLPKDQPPQRRPSWLAIAGAGGLITAVFVIALLSASAGSAIGTTVPAAALMIALLLRRGGDPL